MKKRVNKKNKQKGLNKLTKLKISNNKEINPEN